MTKEHDVYVCTECDWVCSAEPAGSIGTAHAHAERHVGWWILPPWLCPVADPKRLDGCIKRGTVCV
jgi:hypothetical protein